MVDLDLIKSHDEKYPKKARRRNAWAWGQSTKILKHRRNLLKYKKHIRCTPTSFELRGVCSCPVCGQPTSRDNLINTKKIHNLNLMVMEDAKDI